RCSLRAPASARAISRAALMTPSRVRVQERARLIVMVGPGLRYRAGHAGRCFRYAAGGCAARAGVGWTWAAACACASAAAWAEAGQHAQRADGAGQHTQLADGTGQHTQLADGTGQLMQQTPRAAELDHRLTQPSRRVAEAARLIQPSQRTGAAGRHTDRQYF